MVTPQGSWDSNRGAGVQSPGQYMVQPCVASEANGRGFQGLEITLHAWSLEVAFAQSI